MVRDRGKGAPLQLPSCGPKTCIEGKGKCWRKTEGSHKGALHLPASWNFLLCSQHTGQPPLENPVLRARAYAHQKRIYYFFFSSPSLHMKPKSGAVYLENIPVML